MTQVAIRKSGGANIVSIPKVVLDRFGLHSGSMVDLTVEGDRIILTPACTELTLEELLAGSPLENMLLKDEDQQWLNSSVVGREIV